MAQRIARYEDFFLYYLAEHAKRSTRVWHYVGTTAVLIALGYALMSQTWWMIAAAFFLGYGPAWVGHFFFEGNRPATFQYPFWSLISDFRMYWLWLTGGLSPWLEKSKAYQHP